MENITKVFSDSTSAKYLHADGREVITMVNVNDPNAEVWACAYDTFGRPIKGTAGFYRTKDHDAAARLAFNIA